MTDISSIPLNNLVDAVENVHKTAGADSASPELTSSIAAQGLLQSVVVCTYQKAQLAVVADGPGTRGTDVR